MSPVSSDDNKNVLLASIKATAKFMFLCCPILGAGSAAMTGLGIYAPVAAGYGAHLAAKSLGASPVVSAFPAVLAAAATALLAYPLVKRIGAVSLTRYENMMRRLDL